jgi:hypothetical protein
MNLNLALLLTPANRRKPHMLDHCANPKCAKPLRYLREGRIFVFDSLSSMPDSGAKRAHRLEHYWLCGDCSQRLFLEKTQQGIRLGVKPDHADSFLHAGQARAS